jgi:hypothetical protein
MRAWTTWMWIVVVFVMLLVFSIFISMGVVLTQLGSGAGWLYLLYSVLAILFVIIITVWYHTEYNVHLHTYHIGLAITLFIGY